MSGKRLEIIAKALERVNNDTKKMILDMAHNMTEMEIIRTFNQESLDLFMTLINVTKRLGKTAECNRMSGYKMMFDNALKINVKMPLDQYTMVVLEFAADIYAENEDFFMKMTIPDAELEAGNEFSLVRSEMFKNLWKISNQGERDIVKEHMILLTTYAHVYFYKTIINSSKKN